MSVINQMLNDLDERSKRGQNVTVMPSAVQAVPETAPSRGWHWMLGLALFLLVLVLWFAWSRPHAKMEWHASSLASMFQPGAASSPTSPAPTPTPTSAPAPAALPGPSAPAPAATTPATAAPTPLPSSAPDAAMPDAPTPDPSPAASPVASSVVPATALRPPAPASAPVDPGSLKLRLIPELKLLTTKAARPEAARPESALSSQSPVANPARVLANKAEPVRMNADTTPVKQIKALSSQQRAENEFRRGLQAQQQGRLGEAVQALEQALQWDRQHTAARQTLVAWLLEAGQREEAMRYLKEGLAHDPGQANLAMILARLQVDSGQVGAALATLQRSLPYTLEGADYHAFLAALLQRQQNHKEAIEHYQIALRLKPENALWWMGIGISYQAERHSAAARDAYQRAKNNPGLTPGFGADLQAFVEQRMNQLP